MRSLTRVWTPVTGPSLPEKGAGAAPDCTVGVPRAGFSYDVIRMGLCGVWRVLGAAPGLEGKLFESVAWLGLLVLVIVVGVGAMAWMRYRILSSRRHHAGPFTLDELRQLRDRGALSASEYDTLRRRAIADLREAAGGDE
jgi:hypothetical protein